MADCRRVPRPALAVAAGLLGLLLPALGGLPAAEAANWRDLTGRLAPDLAFEETANGLPAGSRVSSFRGRQVVLLVFWLRDCPQCERELGKVQTAHERWGRSGLQVVSVVHKFALDQVLTVMGQRGWTFPVARDPAGRLASVYGGGRRPGYYIIGIDGRVKSSNGMPDAVLQTELGRWRLNELGPLPAELNVARGHVYRGDYGAALRSAEEVGARPGARPEVTAAVAQLAELARQKLQNRVDRAESWYRRGLVKQAWEEYDDMVRRFAQTSLEGRARALHDAFAARAGRRPQ